MRTILLTTVFVIGYAMIVFSQSQSTIFSDYGFIRSKIKNPGIFTFKDSLSTKKLNVPFSTKNPLFNDSKDKQVKIGKTASDNLMVQGGMPILKPEGSLPMPVYRPDSTIQFFMQIKEYKRIPPINFK